jgi:hypothetical protein
MLMAADAAEQVCEAEDANDKNCPEDRGVRESGRRDTYHSAGVLPAELQAGGNKPCDGSD